MGAIKFTLRRSLRKKMEKRNRTRLKTQTERKRERERERESVVWARYKVRKREQGKRGSRRVKKWRLLIKSAKPARERLKPLAHHPPFYSRICLAALSCQIFILAATFVSLSLDPPHMIQLITHLRSENPLDFQFLCRSNCQSQM